MKENNETEKNCWTWNKCLFAKKYCFIKDISRKAMQTIRSWKYLKKYTFKCCISLLHVKTEAIHIIISSHRLFLLSLLVFVGYIIIFALSKLKNYIFSVT